MNSISYVFQNDGLIFNIISINDSEYELFINQINFKELENMEKNHTNNKIDINNKNQKEEDLFSFNNDIEKIEFNNINNQIILNDKNSDCIQQIANMKINPENNNINKIKYTNNIINENKINNSATLNTKTKTRNNKTNLPFQSSDELLKIAIKKEKKHLKEMNDANEKFNNIKNDINLPSFAQNLPISIYHVYQSNNENMAKTCMICLESFIIGRKIITLPCFHIFHVKCISNWLKKKRSCPICKYSIDDKSQNVEDEISDKQNI